MFRPHIGGHKVDIGWLYNMRHVASLQRAYPEQDNIFSATQTDRHGTEPSSDAVNTTKSIVLTTIRPHKSVTLHRLANNQGVGQEQSKAVGFFFNGQENHLNFQINEAISQKPSKYVDGA